MVMRTRRRIVQAVERELRVTGGREVRLSYRLADDHPIPAILLLPDGAGPATPDEPVDLAILFTRSEEALRAGFAPMAARLAPAGMLWVAWPKRASGVATDLTEDRVRAVGLEAGLVDVKVCAIDDVWSGLKFVIRKKDRPGWPGG